MAGTRRNPEKSKSAILKAARHLLAERDFSAMSIRDVAAEAGVSHGLVQHHFGTREQLIAAIIQQEITEFPTRVGPMPSVSTPEGRAEVRRELLEGQGQFEEFARLITRAQLAGVQPETMLDDAQTPARALADSIRSQQHEHAADGLDPALVAAYINAAMFAFSILGPWLMASVGMRPEDLETHSADIASISMTLIASAIDGARGSGSHPGTPGV